MDVSHSFPPSPAFSDCDSLAGIDDLDAFLDSKGKLSHWPTPPSKREIEEDLEVPSEESDYESEDGVDDLDIATVFARELGLDGAQAWDDVLLIEELLVRVRLPIEVLAIAFNILSKLVKQPNVDTLLQDLALDALILSTLSLASIYTNDRPLSASHLARNVAPGPVTAMDIDMANISVMSALDWRIHDCTEGAAIVAALRMFERREPPNYVPNLVQEPYHEPYLKPEPLCLRLTDRHSSGATQWDNGQLTPAASSSCSVAAEFEHSFLPLL